MAKKLSQRTTTTNRADPNLPEIVSVTELPAVLAVLAWGRSGTGKTTFASSFPKPALLLDVREKGTDSVSNVKGLDMAQISTWEEFEAIYWFLKSGNHKYKSVIVDQVTQLQDLAMIKALKTNGKEATDQMSKRDFGTASGLMKTWLLNYRDLIDDSMHVCFLAHDRTDSGSEEGDADQIEPSVGPRIMPSVAAFLNGAVKIIGNTYIRETWSIENKKRISRIEYGMRLGPHPYYTTKVRSPVGVAAPSTIVDPTFDKLVAVLRGEYSEAAVSKRK